MKLLTEELKTITYCQYCKECFYCHSGNIFLITSNEYSSKEIEAM